MKNSYLTFISVVLIIACFIFALNCGKGDNVSREWESRHVNSHSTPSTEIPVFVTRCTKHTNYTCDEYTTYRVVNN